MKTLIHPWQSEQWKQLQHAKSSDRLPHALLLTGVARTEKAAFAEAFARSLLCQQPNVSALGNACDCHSCHLMQGRSHPDALWVEPEKQGQAIKVDQVREINDFIHQTGLSTMSRVVLINPADAMNMNAANALLKTLEEPSQHACLILVCEHPGQLPATVLSRCQRVHFIRREKMTQSDEATAILKQILILNPLEAAAEIKEANYRMFLEVMLSWLMDLLKLQLGADADDIINVEYLSELQALKEKTHIKVNLQMAEQIQQFLRAVQSGFNFNKQLMMETILIRWVNSVGGRIAA